VDTETTGLDPRTDRLRLLQLATDCGVFVIDLFALGDVSALWVPLAATELVFHNAAFDLSFLWRAGFRPGLVCDLLILSRLLTAGTHDGNTLADLAARELGVNLEKSQQTADWSGELSPAQLDYAALDAKITRDLYVPIMAKIKETQLEHVAAIENRAVPAFIWLTCAGAPFDAAGWELLTAEAEATAAAVEEELAAQAPARDGGERWNWRSWQQVKAAFALLGIQLPSTGDAVLAGIKHPLAALLRRHRAAAQRVKAFRRQWLEFAASGRVFASWNQLGTASGRASCKRPNLQQVPKDPRYRRCFQGPPGRALVKADYGQLQLRIAAKVAGDDKMLQSFQDDMDLHTLTARSITGNDEVTKEDRQLAKAVNFGLLFGLSVQGLRDYARQEYDIALSEAQAQTYRDTFFATYPGLARWHRDARRAAWHARLRLRPAGESRTVLGRRRLFDDKTPFTHRLNSPVQGAEADGAKLAMALLWERRHECPGAFPVLFVHDEIVVEADTDQTEQAAEWLKLAMIDGMKDIIAPVPCTVDVSIVPTWGGEAATTPKESDPRTHKPARRRWRKAEIKVALGEGGPDAHRIVPAEVCGPLAVHRAISRADWSVSHVGLGRALGYRPSKDEAKAMAAALLELPVNWDFRSEKEMNPNDAEAIKTYIRNNGGLYGKAAQKNRGRRGDDDVDAADQVAQRRITCPRSS
jgi:DNA polymerase-1